ncbi:uncharacterized protein BHQ10_010091 [Talaromyces amestolkiae]|uniref:Small ribosomal subunit protein mS37 n=1 Tax=Talaromyces amestolkiae TaxID=1196081 RepID=A0A364LE82_TALAM|nr:uncharacterized protein BHQ10_010091 [Talaromyces amestolkiae]RAO74079.1 hypothetical protein BHQ10_010091 [Talaromyces amestolkiae]
MPAKGASTRLNPVRLQTIQHLRVRRPNQQQQNSCATIMSSMLNCWASAGQGNEGCSGLEESLKACMDGRRDSTSSNNAVNYHLMRMFPKVSGPRKREGRLG